LKILIDIGHPAHVHLFKNFAWEMLKRGNDVLFSVREKGEVRALLDTYHFDYLIYGNTKKSILSKLLGLFKFN
jgi:uncharacterized protein